jgi:hypothetical protein
MPMVNCYYHLKDEIVMETGILIHKKIKTTILAQVFIEIIKNLMK